jgi:hypothetical protein
MVTRKRLSITLYVHRLSRFILGAATLSHRKPAFPGTFRDNYRAHEHGNIVTLIYSNEIHMFIIWFQEVNPLKKT